MLRKLFLTTVLLSFFAASASLAGGGYVEEQMIQEPLVAHSTVNPDDGMSPEVVAALIAGGLGLTGVVITAAVSINSRRKKA